MATQLKTNVNRTVRLEPDRGPRVVKRFHSPGFLRRLGDGRRARREFELLQRSFEAGLPVPRPLELSRNDGFWEVATEWIPDSKPLEAILTGECSRPIGRRALAEALAELLAQAYRIGLEHDDLHAGNVLVTQDGRPWLVDLQQARITTSVSASRVQSDLVRLCAAVREITTERFRAVFLRKLSQRLTPAQLELVSNDAAIERVEEEGRALRRERVERRLARWTRESGICRATQRAFVRRDVDEDLAGRLMQAQGSERALAVDGQAARRAWLRAARLFDHGVPVTRPLLLLRESERALFEDGDSPTFCTDLKPDELPAIARLIGQLHDRGLATTGLRTTELYRHTDGDLSDFRFGPNGDVRALTAETRASDWNDLVASGNASGLLTPYLEQLKASRAERRRVHEELRIG